MLERELEYLRPRRVLAQLSPTPLSITQVFTQRAQIQQGESAVIRQATRWVKIILSALVLHHLRSITVMRRILMV